MAMVKNEFVPLYCWSVSSLSVVSITNIRRYDYSFWSKSDVWIRWNKSSGEFNCEHKKICFSRRICHCLSSSNWNEWHWKYCFDLDNETQHIYCDERLLFSIDWVKSLWIDQWNWLWMMEETIFKVTRVQEEIQLKEISFHLFEKYSSKEKVNFVIEIEYWRNGDVNNDWW